MAGDPRSDQNKKCFFLITHSPYYIDVKTVDDLKNCIVFHPNELPTCIEAWELDDEYKIKRLLPRLNTHHKCQWRRKIVQLWWDKIDHLS